MLVVSEFAKFDLSKESMRKDKLISDKKYDLWWKSFKNYNPYYNDNSLKNLFIQMLQELQYKT